MGHPVYVGHLQAHCFLRINKFSTYILKHLIFVITYLVNILHFFKGIRVENLPK